MELVIELLKSRLAAEELVIQLNKDEKKRRDEGVKTSPPLDEKPELIRQLKDAIAILVIHTI